MRVAQYGSLVHCSPLYFQAHLHAVLAETSSSLQIVTLHDWQSEGHARSTSTHAEQSLMKRLPRDHRITGRLKQTTAQSCRELFSIRWKQFALFTQNTGKAYLQGQVLQTRPTVATKIIQAWANSGSRITFRALIRLAGLVQIIPIKPIYFHILFIILLRHPSVRPAVKMLESSAARERTTLPTPQTLRWGA